MARTSKYNKGIQDAICEALRKGNTRRCACALVGIDSSTFYAWLNSKPAFSSAVEKAEAEAEERYVSLVAQHALTSPSAAQWWLERRHHLDWRKRETHDIDIANRSDADLAALVARALEHPDAGSEAGGGGAGEAAGGEE